MMIWHSAQKGISHWQAQFAQYAGSDKELDEQELAEVWIKARRSFDYECTSRGTCRMVVSMREWSVRIIPPALTRGICRWDLAQDDAGAQ